MEKRWWKESVVYQIYPRSFCDSNGDGIGDLNGITGKLDYLKELGIDIIWICPIFQSPNHDNGYDISDYHSIMPLFGTMDDFDQLLAKAHEKGLKIVMDFAFNHTSSEHPWFIESRKSVKNPYRDYYFWRPARDGKDPNNWGSFFSGPAWEYDEKTDMYYLHLFAREQPDLNWDNPRVRSDVFDIMNWWIDKGIDGFRLDVISLISKDTGLPDGEPGVNGYSIGQHVANGPHVHEYLQEMREKVLNHADVMSVGECAGVTLEEAKKYARSDGKELDMVFQFEHMSVDEDPKIGKWSMQKMDFLKFKEILSNWQKGMQDIAWNSLYLQNHDQPRCVSRFGDDGKYREISAKMLATCCHMMQGTPYVFQGEEIGMTNAPFQTLNDFRDIETFQTFQELTEKGVYTDKEMLDILRYRSRDNARTPMQWDDSENAGFTTGTPWIMVNPNYQTINVKEQMEREDSVFHYYQKLIKLRHEKDIIVYGSYDLLLPDDEELFVYTRTLDEEKLFVACNFSPNTREINLPEEFLNGRILIGNYEKTRISSGMQLRPWEAFVIDNL